MHIPYAAQIDPYTIKTHQNDFIQIFRIDGIAYDTAPDAELNLWHEQLNMLLRNLSSPNLAIWTHLIRREIKVKLEGDFRSGFARALNEKYQKTLNYSGNLYACEQYVTLVYRSQSRRASRWLGRFVETDTKQLAHLNTQALKRLNALAVELERGLARYGIRRLSTYAGADFVFSEVCEFLQFLCDSGGQSRFPLVRSDLAQALPSARLLFGRETFEARTVSDSTFGAILGIKEYPESTAPGLLNQVLGLSSELVLTQSFCCLDKASARGALKRQRGRLEVTDDDAEQQIAQLSDALGDLAANKFAMGEHHLTLLIKGRNPEELVQGLAKARTALSDAGCVVVREDLALQAAYWSQLPGNFSYRPRPAPITSRNFAGFSPFHGEAQGKRSGNHWGDAVTVLRTLRSTPFHFNYHVGDLGITLITGQSGSGKTATQNFLAAQAEKFFATTIYLDKDRGSEIFVRACGGHYFSLRNGVATGFNPFAVEPTPDWLELLRNIVAVCIGQPGVHLTAAEHGEIAEAVAGVYALPEDDRRLSQLLAFMKPARAGSVAARLKRWCHGPDGAGTHAWVFDNPSDSLDLGQGKLFGFDYTELIDDPAVRTPIMMYLWGRFARLIDGRRLYMFVDEFWKALEDDFFVVELQNRYKTMRKQNWFLVCATQSPADALRSKIAHTVIEQTATFVFLPNPRATSADYVDGFHCSAREFEVLQSLGEQSRRFLIKQGDTSVVCQLDLQDFGDELAVLSGTAANTDLATELRRRLGEDPIKWLPDFHQTRGAP